MLPERDGDLAERLTDARERAAGGGGDGDRIGGERGALALFKLDAQRKCYSITRTLSLVPDPSGERKNRAANLLDLVL